MGHQLGVTVCFILGIYVCIASSQNTPNLEWQFDPFSTDQWFKQKLDHYNSANVQHWPQRYVTSYRFYRLGGPIFLFLSGPGPELSLTDIEGGAIAEYAEEQGAFVIGLEHRFYGKSRPTPDLSTENLNFLTIPQTIEDIAAFVRSWRSRDENSKWVVFGASYLGSLAAWFAQKHPELLEAFVASSAPLELRYEIPEFLENVGQILNETNPKCYDTVAEGFSCLSKIFNEEDCQNFTLADVKDKFMFCADLDRTRPLDATGVFAELFSTINAVVMYHDPSPDSFPDTNLDRFCKHITDETGGKSAMDKIAEKVKEINMHRSVSCAEFRFQTTVDFLRETEWDSSAAKEGYRQLQWQLCNELGWTVASANITQPFGNYITPFLHSEICQNLFGLTETEMRLKVLKANTDLKGKKLNTKCGIFVNGNKDPWHTFSITTPEEAGSCNRAILIEGGSHGRDVEDFSHTPSYPPQVRQAQITIGQYLDDWLKTGRCCDVDSAETKQRIIAAVSRPARASKDNYYAFSSLLKNPNVNIRPRSYSGDIREQQLMSPTSIPHQVSTTDVLSVSPRIPVAESTLVSHEGSKVEGNIFRDPSNSEVRRYRVVKLLRHRPPFSPTTPEPSPAPSMEQFEADFPEHSIRIEGRVERVFKNGTVIPSTESPSAEEIEQQLDMFDKGRRFLQRAMSPNKVTSVTPASSSEKGVNNGVGGKKNRYKYLVKQVFKDVVSVENTNSKNPQTNSQEAESLPESQNGKQVSDSPRKATSRQQSLVNADIKTVKHEQRESSSTSTSSSGDNDEILSTSSSEVSFEESSSNSMEEPLQRNKTVASDNKSKTKSEGVSKSVESSEEDSISTSESIEHSSTVAKIPASSKTNQTQKHKQITSTPKAKEEEESQEDYEDDYDDEGYDDDYYYEHENKKDQHNNKDGNVKPKESRKNDSNKTSKAFTKPPPVAAKTNFSTEFSSGEDTRPRRLREKISEKIMASSETIEGDQRSKEKTKNSKHEHKDQNKNPSESDDNDGESLENGKSSQELFSSEEEHNFSLEPSGSNPSKSYRKKQLAPITTAVEPSTVIKVEISGSYPTKKMRRRKKSKQVTSTESSNVPQNNDSFAEKPEDVTQKPKRRKIYKRRKVISSHRTNATETSRKPMKSIVTTTSTTTASPLETETFAELNEQPPTNNYATWNKDTGLQAVSVQQEAPSVVPIDLAPNKNPAQPESDTNGNNDVVYIIIGDIPVEDSPSMINENPSHEDLFNFIQRLVNRHSPRVFTPQDKSPNSRPTSYTPPTTTTTTTTTTTPIVENPKYLDYSGKYLLVRPVQVVPIGHDHVVHAQDLKNESLIDLMTMETPQRPYHYNAQAQNLKRQNNDLAYRFKSPLHRDHFERLLSVDGQVRDSDRVTGHYRQNYRRLDQIPDPSWRSIRGISQFGPVVPPQKRNSVSGLLSLSAADTMWVNEGVPFLPRSRQLFSRNRSGQSDQSK